MLRDSIHKNTSKTILVMCPQCAQLPMSPPSECYSSETQGLMRRKLMKSLLRRQWRIQTQCQYFIGKKKKKIGLSLLCVAAFASPCPSLKSGFLLFYCEL